MGHSPKQMRFKVAHVWPLRPKGTWYGLHWKPSTEDIRLAATIAASHVAGRFADLAEFIAAYPTDPAGMLVVPDKESLPLGVEFASGEKLDLRAAAGWARFLTHRILPLQLKRGGAWISNVNVDMDDLQVVPDSWTPSEEDIKKAEAIAVKEIEEMAREWGCTPEQLKPSRAWGEYDFGPARRLVSLLYEKEDGMGTLQRYVTVDLDREKMFEK